MKFIVSLEYTLRHNLPQEKLVALRQCIERICINRTEDDSKLEIHEIPASNLTANTVLVVTNS